MINLLDQFLQLHRLVTRVKKQSNLTKQQVSKAVILASAKQPLISHSKIKYLLIAITTNAYVQLLIKQR